MSVDALLDSPVLTSSVALPRSSSSLEASSKTKAFNQSSDPLSIFSLTGENKDVDMIPESRVPLFLQSATPSPKSINPSPAQDPIPLTLVSVHLT
jgi:hypothetical protein